MIPQVINFEYKDYGSTETRPISLEIISAEFFEDHRKALRIYTQLRSIEDKYFSKTTMAQIEALKADGLPASIEYMYKLGELTDQEEKDKVNNILFLTPSFDREKYTEIYEYLVDNLLQAEFEDLKIDWFNPSVPFMEIAAMYLELWKSVFLGSGRSSNQNSQNEKPNESESEPNEKSPKSKKTKILKNSQKA